MTKPSSKAEAIRKAITNAPGITHDQLINEVTNNSRDDIEIKKAADLITYVIKQGGYVLHKTPYGLRSYSTATAKDMEPIITHETDAINLLLQTPNQNANHIGDDTKMVSALQTQEGGNHYKLMKIQPVEYIIANQLGFCEGSIVKYVSRYKNKNGIEDLKKARHFLDILIEHESVA